MLSLGRHFIIHNSRPNAKPDNVTSNTNSTSEKFKVNLAVYTYNIYLCCIMKTLSLKLDDDIFEEAEEITNKLHLARNRYINEAVSIYNRVNKKRLLKKQLAKESILTSKDSLEILHEFEKLLDEN